MQSLNGRKILSNEMNSEHVLFVFSENKLMIFDLKEFDLVKEIEVQTNHMKLVSNRYLALFHSYLRSLCLYDQVNFEKVSEINLELEQLIGYDHAIASDRTELVLIGDHTHVTWFSIAI